MTEIAHLQERIGRIFETKLNLVVPSADTDLFETGGLDSLTFVELLLELEREYGVKVDLEDLELGNFQSIANIAEFIAQRLGQQNETMRDPGGSGNPARCRQAKNG